MSKSKKVSKVINPQRKLEALKTLVKQAGGKMSYEGKTWNIRRGKKTTELTSRELARYSNPQAFAKAVGLPRISA